MSRAFDEAMEVQGEAERHKDVARELGISEAQLDELGSYEVQLETGNDDHPLSYLIIFHELIPDELQGMIKGLMNDTMASISLNAFDRPEPEEY